MPAIQQTRASYSARHHGWRSKHPTLQTARFVTLVGRNQRDSGLENPAEILVCQPSVRHCSGLDSEIVEGPQEQGPGAMGEERASESSTGLALKEQGPGFTLQQSSFRDPYLQNKSIRRQPAGLIHFRTL